MVGTAMAIGRGRFSHDGLWFSYLDAGGDGAPLVALHAHWLEGQTFAPLALELAPAWRVVALDQRGHGQSDHARTYTRDDYLGDLGALLRHLSIDHAVLLGNSLGAVNAFQFAARHAALVRALIIVDIFAEIGTDPGMAGAWAGTFPTRQALLERVGPRFAPFLLPSFRETRDGWTLAFDPKDMAASQVGLNGDHWPDWLASSCPALVIRGAESRVTTAEQMQQMASRRPNTQLVTLEAGHVAYMDNVAGFTQAVRAFLDALPPRR
jgi:pimeloyl-ACP methyl ester carboxylesterase